MQVETLLVFEAPVTWMLTGLIWTIQIIHYPLFLKISPADFNRYEAQHCARITWIVAPLMLLELLCSSARLVLSNYNYQSSLLFSLVAVIWLATAFVQMPLHTKLQAGWNEVLIKKLVSSNWIRTIAWTARAVILFSVISF